MNIVSSQIDGTSVMISMFEQIAKKDKEPADVSEDKSKLKPTL